VTIALLLVGLALSAVCAHFACVRLDDAERRIRDLECVVRGMLKDDGIGDATCFLLLPGDTRSAPPGPPRAPETK